MTTAPALPSRRLVDRIGRLNWGIITLLCALAIIGVMMHFSNAGGFFQEMPLTHAGRFIGLLVLVIGFALMPPRYYYMAAYPLYVAALLLLVAVELVGETRMGATRWLSVGPVSIQPSELMKIAIVLTLARYYNDLKPQHATSVWFALPALFIIAAPVGLIMHQPDLGTSMLVALAGFAIMFLAGLRWRYIIPAGLVAIVGAVVAYFRVLHEYQRARIEQFLGLVDDPLGEGYHVAQSKIAIGAAGFFGQGWGQGSQSQHDFLPETHTDFIYTMIVEEFGLLGGLVVLGLFGALMWQALEVAQRARTIFGKLAASGVAATLACYVLINTGMVMGLVPVVGIPLPLISYGGTAMVTLMAGFAIVLSIDLHRDQAGSRGLLW
ncbi:MAG: rod shape-determining protein RodA [Hyphomonadaceae bacterium]